MSPCYPFRKQVLGYVMSLRALCDMCFFLFFFFFIFMVKRLNPLTWNNNNNSFLYESARVSILKHKNLPKDWRSFFWFWRSLMTIDNMWWVCVFSHIIHFIGFVYSKSKWYLRLCIMQGGIYTAHLLKA